jgi:hypothetical protein
MGVFKTLKGSRGQVELYSIKCSQKKILVLRDEKFVFFFSRDIPSFFPVIFTCLVNKKVNYWFLKNECNSCLTDPN